MAYHINNMYLLKISQDKKTLVKVVLYAALENSTFYELK